MMWEDASVVEHAFHHHLKQEEYKNERDKDKEKEEKPILGF